MAGTHVHEMNECMNESTNTAQHKQNAKRQEKNDEHELKIVFK